MPLVFDPAAQITTRRHCLAVHGNDDVATGEDRLVANRHAAASCLDAGLLRASRDLLHEQALLIRRQA
ncbi:MAG: hypothetical protein E6I75_23320 [Chloroflexi bacterium]|nr:MAG: hypothetical protein E6I75_23320 [Chloroflexota bacterium]